MKSAFTLTELLVVIGIIAVLSAISIPAYQRVTQNARATACIANLGQLGTALNLYLGEHNLTMPVLAAARASRKDETPVIDTVLHAYAPDMRVFSCPADTRHLAETTGTSYYWNSALNGQSAANLNFLRNTTSSEIPVLADKEGFHPYSASKVNILNADGHITQGLHFSVGP